MGYFLAMERGDLITGTPQQISNTIMARIFTNRDREAYGPAEGNRVQDVRPQTNEEQQELEDALWPFATAENDQLRRAH